MSTAARTKGLNAQKPRPGDLANGPTERATPFTDAALLGDGYSLIAAYDYRDGEKLLYQVLRYQHPEKGKTFRQRRPDDLGGWWFGAGDRKVLYRLNDLGTAANTSVFVCEGEKDADHLALLGFTAVTVASGTWSEEAIRALKGYDCFILEDNDEAGRKKAVAAAKALHGTAASVRVVRLPGLPEKGDVTDWLDQGGDPAGLVDIARTTLPWPQTEIGNAEADVLPFVSFDELQVSVRKPWVLKPILALGETSSWVGGPGKGKSALLTDIAIHVAGGLTWRGYKAKGRFAVVYLAFERGDLVKRRLEAYKRKHQLSGLPIVVVTAPVDVMQPGSVSVIVATIQAVALKYGIDVGLLVIDTYAKAIAFGGGDENSAKDQNRVLGHLRIVQQQTDVHVALIGHTGKDEAKGARGSNAHLGDVDVMVQFGGTDVKTAIVTKANDGPEGPLTTFRLEPFDFGPDEDGDPITTSVLSADVPDRPTARLRQGRPNHSEQIALSMLRYALDEVGEKPPASNHIAASVGSVVTIDDWRRYCFQGGISAAEVTEDAKQKAFRRALLALQAKDLIRVWGSYVWLPE